jgi:hypothetical protein
MLVSHLYVTEKSHIGSLLKPGVEGRDPRPPGPQLVRLAGDLDEDHHEPDGHKVPLLAACFFPSTVILSVCPVSAIP